MINARRSIAIRLIVAVLAVELVSALVVVFLSLGYERHAHFTAFDIMLRGRADSVLVAVQDSEDAQANVILNEADLHLPPDDVYEVFDQGGRLLGRSSNWQGTPSGAWTDLSDGFLQLKVGHDHYRVLRLHGSRFVDSGEPGGGKLRPVTIFYGSDTARVWHAIRGAVEFYAAGSLLLLLVTLVLALHLLDLWRKHLHLAHRAVLLDDQREQRGADQQREHHDRPPIAQVEVVVQVVEDPQDCGFERIERIDHERLRNTRCSAG